MATGLLGVQAATAKLLYPNPGRNLRGGFLFDDAVRDGLRLGSKGSRETARKFSNNIYLLLGVYPLVVDNLIVTWAAHGSGDVALQMLGMNLEAYALTGALVLTAQKIGRGAWGVVVTAQHRRLSRQVAIKQLPRAFAADPAVRRRFDTEAQLLASLDHPHIVPIHSVGEDKGLVYFVMGYVDGESVAARIRRRGQLPVEEVRRIMKETADALSAAHAM